MVGAQTEHLQRHAEGRLNHGGWYKIEGKQLAVFAVGRGFRVTEASRRSFAFLDIDEETKIWLVRKIQESEKDNWRWSDTLIRVREGRFCASARGNKDGRFFALQLWRRFKQSTICIPFGVGGRGWAKLAVLFSKAVFIGPKPGEAISRSGEIHQMWEKEVVIVARNLNSRLPWDKIAETLKLDLFPFCNMISKLLLQ